MKVRDALTVACSRVVTLNINTGLMRVNYVALPSPLCALYGYYRRNIEFCYRPHR